MHAGTSRVENSAQGSSCQLKFVPARAYYAGAPVTREKSFTKRWHLADEGDLEEGGLLAVALEPDDTVVVNNPGKRTEIREPMLSRVYDCRLLAWQTVPV
jgi:hypothetical protein